MENVENMPRLSDFGGKIILLTCKPLFASIVFVFLRQLSRIAKKLAFRGIPNLSIEFKNFLRHEKFFCGIQNVSTAK